MADIRTARAAGRPLPDGIALDGEGQPTSIAAEVAALLPRGGQIGSLLGLVVELMAGVAGGGRGDPKGRGVFVIAFDPAAAGERIDWQGKLAGLKSDWTAGGGHWPRGGGLSAEAALDGDFAQRLDTHLASMTGQGGR
jgi:(2R)-3-sulfolactate dehydrogenase (NADP+)